MRAILLLTLVSICSLACKKSDPIVTPGLFGTWELRRHYGSLLGFDSTFKAGNGTVYQFKSDSTYKLYIKYKLVSQGPFHITASDIGINVSTRIYFGNDSGFSEPFYYNGTQMTIGTAADDGIASDYVKIGN